MKGRAHAVCPADAVLSAPRPVCAGLRAHPHPLPNLVRQLLALPLQVRQRKDQEQDQEERLQVALPEPEGRRWWWC
jgi:hypothetical protein